jgi:hypothetical protein
VNIREDLLDESNETISLTAKEPQGPARLSKNASDTITIEDDDSPVAVSWDTDDYIIRTEGGKKLTYKLKLRRCTTIKYPI